MATGRYVNQNQSSGPTYSASSTQATEAGTSSSATSSNSSTSSSGTSRTTYNIDTMSSAGRQALDSLIATLSAGGTEEQRRNQQLLLEQISNLEGLSSQYSRQNAFADAQGLIAQTLRQAMETAMPTILQAQAAAGTSGDALSALLSQDAATRASEAASAQGLGAAVDYGNILASLQGQKTQATMSLEDVVTQSLLQALQTNAGSMKRGTETTKTTGRSSTNKSSVTNSATNQNTSSSQIGAESSSPSDVLNFVQTVGAR